MQYSILQFSPLHQQLTCKILLKFIKYIIQTNKGKVNKNCGIIYSYPLLVFGLADAGFPCPAKCYYMTGHASATSAHATVHSIPVQWMKLTFPPLHLKRDTNTGGAEVPLSWNNIRWNFCFYNWNLSCGAGDSNKRQSCGIFFVLIPVYTPS